MTLGRNDELITSHGKLKRMKSKIRFATPADAPAVYVVYEDSLVSFQTETTPSFLREQRSLE
jgi:hypothetical protein